MSIAESLSKSLTEHSKKHPKKETSKKEVREFRVEPQKMADGKKGYNVTTHYSDQGNLTGRYEEPKKIFHKTLSSVHKHMKAECGEDDGDEGVMK